jgi:pimeloyl-ACP methyl ester carboxylesterase
MRVRFETWTCAVLSSIALGSACGSDDPARIDSMQIAGSFSAGLAGAPPALAGFPAPAGRSAGSSGAGSGSAGRASAGVAGAGIAGSASAIAGRGAAGASGSMAGSVAGGAGMTSGSAGSAAGAMALAGSGGAAGGMSMGMGKGMCCADGNCLCRGEAPTRLTSTSGPYDTAQLRISTGTVVYPTDAEPPFAAVAICGGFLNTGPEMASWGPLYASHGIVTVITTTTGADQPDLRARKLLAALEDLKKENTKSGSPLMGKLSDRFGTSGYSMGGGGTTIASGDQPMLKTSVGLAPYGGSGRNVKVPTLLLCGESDGTAPCSMAQGVYRAIAEPTPKMMIAIPGATHFAWFGPGDAGGGVSGQYALAFQKVYLEGDERWKPLLIMSPSRGTQTTNIK